MRFHHLILAMGAVALLAQACGPTVPDSVAALNKPPGIGNLLKERLRKDLTDGAPSSAPLKFPARIRLIPYDYQTALQSVDQLALFQSLAEALKKRPDLCTDASVLPDAYGDSIGASFDGLLKLAAANRADAFLLVSGRSSFSPATEKSPGFFDWWAHKAFYEANATVEALYVEAPSGRYMPSLQAAGKSGPSLVVPDDTTTGSGAYGLKKSVETQAFKNLAEAVLGQLSAELKAGATPMPTPSASASTDTTATTPATPKPSPTPTGPSSPSADPIATGDAAATH